MTFHQQQLQHPQWKAKRQEIIKRDGKKCRNCGAGGELHVHHRQYHTNSKTGQPVNLWDYPDMLLITLCAACHKKGHQLYKVPIFKR